MYSARGISEYTRLCPLHRALNLILRLLLPMSRVQTDMYREVRHQRAAFVAAVKAIRPEEEPVPAVAVVSFAAPRVGDSNYSMALGNRSTMCPMGVLEPLWVPSYRPGLWNKLAGVGRDWVLQVWQEQYSTVSTT